MNNKYSIVLSINNQINNQNLRLI